MYTMLTTYEWELGGSWNFLQSYYFYKIVHEVQKYKVMQINEITRDS